MNLNTIFCFTGTGNSLKAAKDISKQIPDCDIQSMAAKRHVLIAQDAQWIGFVFPVYYLGIPLQVQDFINSLDFQNNNPYIFAISTCAKFHGNSLRQVNMLLEKRGTKLSYGNFAHMGDNAVALYNAKGSNPKIEEKYKFQIEDIMQDIRNKKIQTIKREIDIISHYHNLRIKNINKKDIGYQISDSCISCGICEKVCPAKNIELKDGKPHFNHQCQQCMACIQLCPKSAINYMDKTKTRCRYHNEFITTQELAGLNNYGRICPKQ